MIEIDWRSCESMAIEYEQLRMEQWIKTHAEEQGRELRILEIGSYLGQSTALLASFGMVFSIDTHGNVDQVCEENYAEIGTHHFLAFIGNMTRLRLIDRVFPITSTSSVLDFLPYMAFDVAFIDAGHFYEDVKKDIEKSVPHIASRGLLILDDYKRDGYAYPTKDGSPMLSEHDPWIGVAQAVDELLEERNFEVVEHYYGKICLRRIQ
jgi:predicted O-methyltransferase YrrM